MRKEELKCKDFDAWYDREKRRNSGKLKRTVTETTFDISWLYH